MEAAGHLRAFVERVERLEEEIKSLNDDKKEVYAEAKGTGFDVPTIKRVISKRRKDSVQREEEDALFDLYWSTLHGAENESPSRVRVHVHEGPAADEGAHDAAETISQPDEANSSPLHSGQPETPNSSPAVSGYLSEPFQPPAFLRKTAADYRPHCQSPHNCAASGLKHCYGCQKLVDAAASESELA